MRVVAGQARGKKLLAPEGGEVTRPTLDRVKEGVFSSLQFILPGARVLDLFAGSGQLGIEALSRGASFCVFIEQDREAKEIVLANLKNTGLARSARVAQADVYAFLAVCKEKFDIIMLDPPYRGGLVQQALPLLAKVAAPGATVLAETEAEAVLPEQVENLQLKKCYKYGTVRVWRYVADEE